MLFVMIYRAGFVKKGGGGLRLLTIAASCPFHPFPSLGESRSFTGERRGRGGGGAGSVTAAYRTTGGRGQHSTRSSGDAQWRLR